MTMVGESRAKKIQLSLHKKIAITILYFFSIFGIKLAHNANLVAFSG